MPEATDFTGLFDWGSLFSGGDISDTSDLLLGSPGLAGLDDWGGLFGGAWPDYMNDPGLGSVTGGEQMYFDTQTGQLVTLAQAQAIDPTFNPQGAASQTPTGLGLQSGTSGVGAGVGANVTPEQASILGQILGVAPGAISALAGLGMLGGATAALFGAGNQPGTATQTSTTTPGALSNPQVQQLLGTPGAAGAAGAGGAPGAYTGGTGLQGAAGQAPANLPGPPGPPPN